MKPDRPLIGAVVSLAAGIAAIFAYCNGSTAFNAGYPFSVCQIHVDFTTAGPAVLGGMALIALGLLLMAWALLAAFVSQIVHLSGRDDEVARIIARSRPPLVETEHYPGPIAMAEHKHET